MFLVCGEALFDVFLRSENGPGALDLEARAGGSPFNVAIGVARLGGRSALLTGISNDLFGKRLVTLLENEGVETGYVVRTGRRTTLSVVNLSKSGQPEYAFYGVGSADTSLEEADLPPLGDEIAGLHFGSYSIAAPPVADAFAALAARAGGRFLSLDPNVRPTVQPDLAVWRRQIDRFTAHADVVKVSMEDLQILYPDAAPEALAARWLEAGAGLVVVTDGGAAVSAFTPDLRVDVAPPPCAVVDTVGAGDAFQAGLLVGLSAQGDPKKAVRAQTRDSLEAVIRSAAQIASATCERRGADMPTLAELGGSSL